MRPSITLFLLALALLAAPATVLAHPGHGGLEPGSIAHWLLELPHAVWIVCAAAAVAGLAYARRRGGDSSRE